MDSISITRAVRGRRRACVLAGALLAIVLGTMAVGIVLSHRDSRDRLLSNFQARAVTSAHFVSTFLEQQEIRERIAAGHLLSARNVSSERFASIVETFGSNAAVLLDGQGRLLDVVPTDDALLGTPMAPRYRHLASALRGSPTVSGVVRSASTGQPVVALAVPFATPYGLRVFSIAYRVSGTVLNSFVNQTIAYSEHHVFLVDASGVLVAASPLTAAHTLAQAAPRLARVLRTGNGEVRLAGVPSTFTAVPVGGTGWRLVIAVPNGRLYGSILGWSQRIPWIIFALVAALALILMGLFWNFLADRARLDELSRRMAQLAQTDTVTGLANRRLLSDTLRVALAYTKRHDQPLSLLMIDLDNFKHINDKLGHAAGDEVLRAVAGCMREVFRETDIYGRWGGDEFLAVLPGADEQEAVTVAERLRQRVRTLDAANGQHGISLSIGCAGSEGLGIEELIARADARLYHAKRAGRDRVIYS